MLHRSIVLSILVALSISSCRHTTEPTTEAGWIDRSSGTASDLIVTQVLNSNAIYVSGGNPLSRTGEGVVLKSIDNGTHWQSAGTLGVSSESGKNVYGIAWLSEQNGFAAGDGQNIWHTMNGGASWNPQSIYTSLNFR